MRTKKAEAYRSHETSGMHQHHRYHANPCKTVSFSYHKNSMRQVNFYFSFYVTNKEIEVQKGLETCLRSHTQ